jgi:Tol biopolymer transport system component
MDASVHGLKLTAGPTREDTMFDLAQYLTQSLLPMDPFTILLLRILLWLVAGSALCVLFAAVGCALAQCCKGVGSPRLPAALAVSGLLCMVGPGGGLVAQTAGIPASVPEIQPRLERLFGSDSIRVGVGLRQGTPGIGISPSPDGRWLLVSVEGEGGARLRLVPAGGGKSVDLAPGFDGQWAPSGEAILFWSPLAAEPHLMRLPISRASGEPLGPARQVTLDPVFGFAVSPDGREVAYATGQLGYSTSLRILPINGGAARTVVDVPGVVVGVRWDAKGEFLHYRHWPDIQVPELAVMKVPVEGGDPQRVSVWHDWIRLSPDGQYLYRDIASGDKERNRYELATVDGRPLATFSLPAPFQLAGFGDGPGEFFVVRRDAVNPLRVVPVAGGPVRRLNEAWGYDLALGWTPDAREVFFATELNGERIFMLAPLDGGRMRQVPIPDNHLPGAWAHLSLSGDGQRVLYLSAGRTEEEHGIWMYDIARDTAIQVDEGRIPSGTVGGRWSIGGSREGGGFLYGLSRGGRHELLEARPDGSRRVLWTFPDRGAEPPTVRVHGDRIAFTENDGEEGSLLIARVGEDRPRLLLTLPGYIGARGSNPPAWSPDGRLLAVSFAGTGEDRQRQVLLVEVTEAGELAGEPRFLLLDGGPSHWHNLAWLPDGQHFLVLGATEDAPAHNDVWLVSIDPETPPVRVTGDVEGTIWSFVLSPDGRFIAPEAEISRGSSVWRVDLGDLLTGSGQPLATPGI